MFSQLPIMALADDALPPDGKTEVIDNGADSSRDTGDDSGEKPADLSTPGKDIVTGDTSGDLDTSDEGAIAGNRSGVLGISLMSTEANTAEVGSWEGFKAALGNNSIEVIKITDDIESGGDTEGIIINRKIHITTDIEAESDYEVTLDQVSITVSDGGDLTIDGALRIIGEYFQVIRVEGGNANINGGMIIASGVYTIGVEVNNGTVNINGGTVTAEGMDSCGISAADSEVNINGGEITASGDRSYGVTVFYGGNANINGGTITASGDGSYGVAVLLGMAEINGGTITATDEEGYAIYIYNNGCVNITASSGLSIIGGVFYSDGPQLLTNSLPSPINVNLCEVEQTSFEFNPCVEFEIYEDEPSSELNASYNGNTVTLIPQKVGLFNLVLIPKDGYNLKIIIPVSVIVCDGEGTSDSPFLISNAAHLIAISKYDDLWSKHFRQTADISLEGVDWTPIGNYENIQFTGTYDGNGKTISNLTIVYDGWDVGLFGDIGTGAVVKNITLVDVSISSGMDLAYVGALVGGNNGGEIINCSVIGGSVEFSGYGGFVGGLVGCNEGNEGNEGSISGCKSDVVVVNTGEENKIGGLVGFNYEYATIEDCESSGNATGEANSHVGGLVGENRGTITGCISSCSATSGEEYTTDSYWSSAGGLVGHNYGTITNCESSGDATGGDKSYVGGLVGENRGTITGCISSGSASCGEGFSEDFEPPSAGGLVGYNYGFITNCESSGDATGGYNSLVGGLVGYNDDATIEDCESSGNATGGDYSLVGGLVGFNDYATIEGCESSGNATGGADSYVGGLVGNNYYGAITDCVSSGYAIGGESSCVGALVGYDYVVSLQLTGISIDASAAKKVYWVGDSLDVRGLKVIGHYTGNNSAVLSVTVTTNDVTGFDSSRPAASKTLTVTLFEFTATYSIAINVPPSDDTPAPTTTPAPGTIQVDYTVTNGTATLQLPTSKINEIIEKSDGKVAVIDLSGDSRVASAQFPTNVLTSLKDAGLDMSVKLPSGTITLDSEVAASIASQAEGNNIRVELAQTSPETLTSEQRETVGSGDIVLDINISSGNRKISTFDGTLTIQIPYDGPLPVAVWYLNDAGELERLNCTYKDGAVIFTLDHLSLYVVGQDNKWQNPFTDVKEGSWYYTAVGFIAEKGITTGTSPTTFSPDETLTRGQFITLLMRAYKIAPNENPVDNFSDAGNTYYTGYLAAAKLLGISKGVGDNKFAPEQAINRQEMFTLLYNALKHLNRLPDGNSGKSLSDFPDSGNIDSWAIEALSNLVNSGIVAGSNGYLRSTDTTTRAEMAQVLYNLLGR